MGKAGAGVHQVELPKWAKLLHHERDQPTADPWNVLRTLRQTQMRRAAEALMAQNAAAKRPERQGLLNTWLPFGRWGCSATLICWT